jgi:hypothetical protein
MNRIGYVFLVLAFLSLYKSGYIAQQFPVTTPWHKRGILLYEEIIMV